MPTPSGGFRILAEPGPIVAAAIHGGHARRAAIAAHMALDQESRLREEDPHTADWVVIGDTQIVVERSRFEVDLNRPRASAVYQTPAESWGLRVWRDRLPPRELAISLAAYDDFYTAVRRCMEDLLHEHDRLVVLDLHSYNHRRDGPHLPPADQRDNPDVNVGTGTLADPSPWRPLIDGFVADLSGLDCAGRQLDVRENIKFRGGHFARWLHDSFPNRVCCLSVEVKKFFMDEWTGQLNQYDHASILAALRCTLPRLRRFLAGHRDGEDTET
jgi:N-formylglutamate deformylase